jgi:hypothetical protein
VPPLDPHTGSSFGRLSLKRRRQKRQGTLPSIGFRNIGSLGRLRSIRPSMDSAVQICQLLIQARLVLLPRHAIDSWCSSSLQGVEAVPQQIDGDVVEQRGEPRPLIFACCLTHTKQVAQPAGPVLGPGRGRLPDVLLGRLPSLHALRQRFPAVVRDTSTVVRNRPTPRRRACRTSGSWPSPTGPPPRRAPTGSPGSRAWSFHACRRVLAPPAVLPSVTCHGVGTLIAIISQLNTLPACAPVNASMAALRLATHDSGSGWLATPFLCDSFIHYSMPALSLRTTRAAKCELVSEFVQARADQISAFIADMTVFPAGLRNASC